MPVIFKSSQDHAPSADKIKEMNIRKKYMKFIVEIRYLKSESVGSEGTVIDLQKLQGYYLSLTIIYTSHTYDTFQYAHLYLFLIEWYPNKQYNFKSSIYIVVRFCS